VKSDIAWLDIDRAQRSDPPWSGQSL